MTEVRNSAGQYLGTKKLHLSILEAAAFKRKIDEYLERTGTTAMQLSIWARGYPSAIYILRKAAEPTKEMADYFNQAMLDHPEGSGREARPRKSDGNHNSSGESRIKSEKIEAMREERRNARADHVAACRDAHLKRYGPDAVFGRSLRKMPI